MIFFYILLTLSNLIFPVECICVDHFPLRETSDIIKQIVEKYAKTVNSTDGEETWINHLLLRSESGYELNGVTYYVNDNHLNTDNTFYFDSLRFLKFPVYVVENKETMESWRSSHPDNTYALSKISLNCPVNYRACGLKCCPSVFYEVMNAIQEHLVTSPNPSVTNETLLFNGVTYALHPPQEETSLCEYEISYYDVPLRSFLNQASKIYFNCGNVEECCGLICLEKPKQELITQEKKTRIKIPKKLYPIASVFLLMGFMTIAVIARRKTKRYYDIESTRSSAEKFLKEEA